MRGLAGLILGLLLGVGVGWWTPGLKDEIFGTKTVTLDEAAQARLSVVAQNLQASVDQGFAEWRERNGELLRRIDRRTAEIMESPRESVPPTPRAEEERAPPATPKPFSVDLSPEAQTKRKVFMRNFIDLGVLSKVDRPGDLPHLWTGPGWGRLSFDEKASIAGLVYALYYGEQVDGIVAILDGRTGESIGHFCPKNGGLAMK